ALVGQYYREKIYPLIQVSPSDIRSYYEQHRATDYTKMAAAKFRLIKISVVDRGSIPDATRVIDRVLEQLKGGKDFATLAKSYNDDRTLKQNGGLVGQDGWMQKGSYV